MRLAPLLVVYDGECPFCRRSKATFQALDWLSKLTFRTRLDISADPAYSHLSPEGTLQEMQVVGGGGKVAGGFFAVRAILLRLPLTFLPALLMYIPGVHLLGVPVYRWVAARRRRCTDDCAV